MKYLWTATLWFLILSCGKPAALEINDDLVANYIRAFEKIRLADPAYARDLVTSLSDTDRPTSAKDPAKVFRAIHEGGFEDFAGFIELNSRIVSAYNSLRTGNFVTEMEKAQKESEERLSKYLEDPKVPPEAREKIRVSLEKMRETNRESREKVTGTVDMVQSFAREEDRPVVEKHREELARLYGDAEVDEKSHQIEKDSMPGIPDSHR